MTDDAVLGITMTDGSAEADAEIALAADLPRRTAEFRAYLPPSECKGEAESVTLSLGGKELLSAEVPPADGGLLGAEASVAMISVTEGCADGGAALSDMLAGLSGGSPGLDCILGDGTRVTLAATVEKSGDGVRISASAPEGTKLFVITTGGDGAAAEAAQERISASETIVCTVPGCITTSEICGAALQGAQARELPVRLADVRTFPPLPPAEKLESHNGVLVAFGYGRVSAVRGLATLTERAAANVTSVYAAADGTLAYVSDGVARMCRGTTDFCAAEGGCVALTGEGNGAVMHVLGGGYVRGYGVSGACVYERESDAFALSALAGSVLELSATEVRTFGPDGELVGSSPHGCEAAEALSRFDGGFVALVSDNGVQRTAVITPRYVRTPSEELIGCDGTLFAVRGENGVRVVDVSGSGSAEVGGADSGTIAFADALYSLDGERITRRAALGKRTLLLSADIEAGKTYTAAGVKETRAASAVVLTAKGG